MARGTTPRWRGTGERGGSLISDPWALVAIIAGMTAMAFWLDLHYRWARQVGATMLVIVFGAVLSNLGVVPFRSVVYDAISGPVTSLSIVWLLFAVDVRDLKAAGPRMLAAFAIACLATMVGAVVAGFAFNGDFNGDAWKLAGVMTGTYAGGSINFVAVGRSLDFPPALFAAATASDAVMTALWFAATLMIPIWLRRYFPAPKHRHAPAVGPEVERAVAEASAEAPPAGVGDAAAGAAVQDPHADHPFFSEAPLRILDVSLLIGLGFALMWAAERMSQVVSLPSVLWLTTFALVLGHTPWVRQIKGDMHLGALGLHLFLATIGIASRFSEIARVGPDVFWFTATVVGIHGLLTYGGARLARLDLETTSVASQAAIGGPSSALALAVGREWKALVLPGVVVGLLGYAVGNYLGLGVAYWLRGLLAG